MHDIPKMWKIPWSYWLSRLALLVRRYNFPQARKSRSTATRRDVRTSAKPQSIHRSLQSWPLYQTFRAFKCNSTIVQALGSLLRPSTSPADLNAGACSMSLKASAIINELHPAELRTVNSWIHTCVSEHKECVPLTSGRFLPTRLLDLKGPAISLIDSKGLIPSNAEYVALSYCWGTTMPETGKTTKETESERRKEIMLHLLPRTLREAVYVTRLLKIPYLWVDALCIIQGDREDWLKESAMMCQVLVVLKHHYYEPHHN